MKIWPEQQFKECIHKIRYIGNTVLLVETWNTKAGVSRQMGYKCKHSIGKIYYQNLSNFESPSFKTMKFLSDSVRYVGFYNTFIENSIILTVRQISPLVKWHMAASREEANIVYYKWEEIAGNFEIWNRYTLKLKPYEYVLNVHGYKVKSMMLYFCQMYIPLHVDSHN